MTTDLTDWVYQRLAQTDTDDDVALVVVTALEGDAQLDETLAGGSGALPVVVRPVAAADDAEAAERPGTFLSALRVQGFRGIGEQVVVPFHPAPGLTVIAGRNGSGKSSLAEALELLLTGGTYRWRNKPALWKERWRNLHAEAGAQVELEVLQEGTRPTTLRTSWADTATDVDDRTTSAQERGARQTVGPDPLGWQRPLATYRPILSYDELGGLLEGGPSQLYDALASVLGVEQLAAALKRIQARLKDLKAPGAPLDARRKELRGRAQELDDERAGALATLLAKKAPDAAAVTALVTGAGPAAAGTLGGLRALVNLDDPDLAAVGRAAERLRGAVQQLTVVAQSESHRRRDRVRLRRDALELHAAHGDQSCPVCAAGTLDETWARSSRELVAAEERELDALIRSADELDQARAGARRVLTARPRALDSAPAPGLEPVVAAAREAWDAWAAAPDADDHALTTHLETAPSTLATALAAVRSAAGDELAARDDRWTPLARDTAAWITDWVGWQTSAHLRTRLAAAEAWLKEHDTQLKNERLAPIADGARRAWGMLRQESNVELGELRLGGTATRRRVEITAAVDGNPTDALPVMSQGELHALALALFLPRAESAQSPFRFVVLDDPVQAMDPAKVQGLVDLLAVLAQTRQVVVLSHDDRLPSAVRRSQVPARILEVTRGTDSAVTVREVTDPAARYLDDAHALVRDRELPAESVRRTLPGLLRMAVEAAARDTFFAARLRRGDALGDVEQVWDRHPQTRHRVGLAVFDEARPELGSWLGPDHRRRGMGCVTSGLHDGLYASTDLGGAVHDVTRLVSDIRGRVRA